MNSAQLFYYIAMGLAGLFALGAVGLGVFVYISAQKNKVLNRTLADVAQERQQVADEAVVKETERQQTSIFDDVPSDDASLAPAAPRLRRDKPLEKSAQFDFTREHRVRPAQSAAPSTRAARRVNGPVDFSATRSPLRREVKETGSVFDEE